jgi:hypothetical protein
LQYEQVVTRYRGTVIGELIEYQVNVALWHLADTPLSAADVRFRG